MSNRLCQGKKLLRKAISKLNSEVIESRFPVSDWHRRHAPQVLLCDIQLPDQNGNGWNLSTLLFAERTNGLDYYITVLLGQANITQQHLRLKHPEVIEYLFDRAASCHVSPVEIEQGSHQLAAIFIVIDHQNSQPLQSDILITAM
jgi:hypothetical protein